MMKPLIFNPFKGAETVKANKALSGNAAFISSLKHFEGKLSSTHYVIKFPVQGVEHYRVDKHQIDLDKNSYTIVNPEQEVTARVQSKENVIGVCVGCSKQFIQRVFAATQQDVCGFLDCPDPDLKAIEFHTLKYHLTATQFSFFLQQTKEYALHQATTELINEDQFFLTLAEQLISSQLSLRSKLELLPQVKMAAKVEVYRRIELMNQFIHDNYAEEVSLDEVSKMACLSKYHAIRCYQKIMGISPYQKILQLRMKKAAELLRRGISIGETADLCGFSDYRSFSKKFKQYYGMPPSKF